jgi:hypothetical protein
MVIGGLKWDNFEASWIGLIQCMPGDFILFSAKESANQWTFW